MADNAHDVGLAALIVDGVAHGFAIDGQVLVAAGVDAVPFLQGAVETDRIDADEHISDGRQARHAVTAVAVSASEAPARFLSEAFGPIGDGLIAAHAAQGCRGGNGQDRIEAMAPALGPTRIGDVGEKSGQRMHVLSWQHDFGPSCLIKWWQHGSGQERLRIVAQRFDENHFGRVGRVAVTFGLPMKAFGVADEDPVVGFVDGSAEAHGIDEGFEQQHGMTESGLPVGGQPFAAQGQDTRWQVRQMPFGQDQKAAVVCQQLEPIVLMTEMPADPAIACGTLQGGSGKADQADPLIAEAGRIAQRFTDFWQGAQVMMPVHQMLETPILIAADQPDNDLLELRHIAPLEQKMPDRKAM